MNPAEEASTAVLVKDYYRVIHITQDKFSQDKGSQDIELL